MILTTPTARATTKTLRYSLDQARVVAVATTAITIVLATHRDCSARLLLPPGVLYSSVLVDGAAPFPPTSLLQRPARSLELPSRPESLVIVLGSA